MDTLSLYKALPNVLKEELDRANDYLAKQFAHNTLRAYRADFNRFYDWCQTRGLEAKPTTPQIVALFLSAEAESGVSPATLGRRLTSIQWVHQQMGFPSPTQHQLVTGMLAGIRRTHSMHPRRQKEPFMDDQMIALKHLCTKDLRGLRDRALLTLGFAGAFRRSELVALRVEDLRFNGENLECIVRQSKTDQEGKGLTKPILNGRRLKPVDLLKEWLSAAQITEGYVFRPISRYGRVLERGLSDQMVAKLLKEYAQKLGLDPIKFGAHSLRSGYITSAGEHDAPIYKIMEVSNHRDPRTLLTYLRRPNMFKEHSGDKFM